MTEIIRIFLSYAREDEKAVDQLYQRLSGAGFKPWMDRKDILPGERWDTSIENAIQTSDFFLACLSTHSINKRGVIQRELEDALSIWQSMSLHDIYLIPVRLEECDMPRNLRHLQWVNLFEEEGWAWLLKAIQVGMARRAKAPAPTAAEVAAPEREQEPGIPVQAIAACLRHGWVVDPWHENNPYKVMEALFIGPRSSMQEIRACLPTQRTKAQEEAWKQLQDLPSRLFVDSFLYRVEKSRELIAAVKEHLSITDRLPSREQIPPPLQNDWPLILLLAGKRDEGLSAWIDVVQTTREGTDPAFIHGLAVAYTFTSKRLEEEGQIGAAVASWRKALAYWAWIVDRDDYWAAWADSRIRHYQVHVTPQHISDLRRRLHDHFGSRFSDGGHVLPTDCPAETRQAYTELGLEWRVERAGLQALRRLQADRPDPLKVKPEAGLLVLRELNLQKPLAQLVLERTTAAEDIVFLLTAMLDAQQVRQSVQDVRFYFSQLGRARAWLDSSQPEQALAAMPAEGDDQDFDGRNPAYSLLADKQSLWGKDRADLIMRAHLQLAEAHLKREPWNVEAIATQWIEALSQSGPLGDADLAINLIQDQAMAYLQPIVDDRGKQRQQLALAEAAEHVIGSTPRLDSVLRRLRSTQPEGESPSAPSKESIDLRDLLEKPDRERTPDTSWQGQANKLYAVLQANPADGDVREELANLLVEQLEQMIFEEQIEAARQVADEWYAKLDGHPLLHKPYRYLHHGHKISSYLDQTDLIYHPNLLETYSYSLRWHMKHKEDIVVRLEVEGDLVRVIAPLLGPQDSSSADVRHNLLQATGDTPLYKAYTRSNGETGLMFEVLAHSLTPGLLDQLIRLLAFRVDLSPSQPQSLESLQQVMHEHLPNLSLRAEGPPTEEDLERWQGQLLAQCREMDLECTLAGGFTYRLKRRTARGGTLQLELQAPVVTLQTRIGDQYQMDRSLYERMMGWNYSTRLCKLTLTADRAVLFRCEVLDLHGEETLARLLALALEGLAQAESLLAWHML